MVVPGTNLHPRSHGSLADEASQELFRSQETGVRVMLSSDLFLKDVF